MDEKIHKLNVGDIFHDRYRLIRMIGVGGFAEVWRAEDVITGVTKAIKVYASLDDEAFRDLAAEYACMEGMNHPALLHADHFDRCGTMPYLTMKFCAGGSLMHSVGRATTEELLDIIHDIAGGLTYLHDSRMVHQDIKPANILVDFHTNDKVTYLLSDFGISSKSRTRLTKSVRAGEKTVAMTEAYAPPEKFSPKRVDRLPNPKGDIFSFGLTLYELSTGSLPFSSLATGREMFYNNVEIDLTPVRDPVIRRFIARCIMKNPDDRPTADELIPLLTQLSKESHDEDDDADILIDDVAVEITGDNDGGNIGNANGKSGGNGGGSDNGGTVRIDVNRATGKNPVRIWYENLTSTMKLSIIGVAAFAIVLLFTIPFIIGNRSASDSKSDVATLSTPTVKEVKSPIDFDVEGINTHYVEVLGEEIELQKQVREIVKGSPTFDGLSNDDKETVRLFIRHYYYLTTNKINDAYPPETPGDAQVKNPYITDKINSMKIIYDNIQRKYSAEWTDINLR